MSSASAASSAASPDSSSTPFRRLLQDASALPQCLAMLSIRDRMCSAARVCAGWKEAASSATAWRRTHATVGPQFPPSSIPLALRARVASLAVSGAIMRSNDHTGSVALDLSDYSRITQLHLDSLSDYGVRNDKLYGLMAPNPSTLLRSLSLESMPWMSERMLQPILESARFREVESFSTASMGYTGDRAQALLVLGCLPLTELDYCASTRGATWSAESSALWSSLAQWPRLRVLRSGAPLHAKDILAGVCLPATLESFTHIPLLPPAEGLGSFFQSATALRTVDVRTPFFGAGSAVGPQRSCLLSLVAALSGLEHLRELRLSFPSIAGASDPGVIRLAVGQLLSTNHSSLVLTELELQGDWSGSARPGANALVLVEVLFERPTIEAAEGQNAPAPAAAGSVPEEQGQGPFYFALPPSALSSLRALRLKKVSLDSSLCAALDSLCSSSSSPGVALETLSIQADGVDLPSMNHELKALWKAVSRMRATLQHLSLRMLHRDGRAAAGKAFNGDAGLDQVLSECARLRSLQLESWPISAFGTATARAIGNARNLRELMLGDASLLATAELDLCLKCNSLRFIHCTGTLLNSSVSLGQRICAQLLTRRPLLPSMVQNQSHADWARKDPRVAPKDWPPGMAWAPDVTEEENTAKFVRDANAKGFGVDPQDKCVVQ